MPSHYEHHTKTNITSMRLGRDICIKPGIIFANSKTDQNDDGEKMTMGCVMKQIIEMKIILVMMMKKK